MATTPRSPRTPRDEELIQSARELATTTAKENEDGLATDFVYAMNDITQATSYLSSSLTLFAEAAKKVEQRFKELEDKENYLREIQQGLSDRIKQLEEAETMYEERELEWEEKERGWEEKERIWQEKEKTRRDEEVEWQAKQLEWREIEIRMTALISKLDPHVHLNVGGQRFTTTKETLLQVKNSYFEIMLGNSNAPRDKNGEFFIDHDPKYFGVILNYLRESKLRNSELETADLSELQEEFRFFKLPIPPLLMKRSVERASRRLSQPVLSVTLGDSLRDDFLDLFDGGSILAVSHKHELSVWLPRRRFTLIYKGTRDGFHHSDFHRACDNKGPTLTVIQSTGGYIFGGFTATAWECLKTYKSDPATFIFTLSNPHNIPPTAYALKPTEVKHAIFCHHHHCAVFGYGCDIYLSSDSDSNTNSFTRFPHSFIDTTNKKHATFTGTRNFTTSDVEVFAVS